MVVVGVPAVGVPVYFKFRKWKTQSADYDEILDSMDRDRDTGTEMDTRARGRSRYRGMDDEDDDDDSPEEAPKRGARSKSRRGKDRV